jgi:hypothetical protein
MAYRDGHEPRWTTLISGTKLLRKILWFRKDARPSGDEAASGERPVGFFVRVECDVDSKTRYLQHDNTKSLIVDNSGYLVSTFEVLNLSTLQNEETCRRELRSMLEMMLQDLKCSKEFMESIVPKGIVEEITTLASGGPQDLFFSFAIKVDHELLISRRTILDACEIRTTPTDEKCMICLDYMKPSQRYVIRSIHLIGCNHPFHKDCISRWLQENQKCPTCRKDVKLSVLETM